MVIYCIYIYTGKNLDRFDSVKGVEVWQVPVIWGSQFLWSFGTIDGEGELMWVVWPQMEHVFVVWRKGDTVLPFVSKVPTPTTKEDASLAPSSPVSSPDPAVYIGCPCLPKNIRNKHPVDLLVTERSSDSRNPKSGQGLHWERTIKQIKAKHQPRVILKCSKTSTINWDNGPTTKGWFARWS